MALNTEHVSRCIRSLENALQRLRESEPGGEAYDVFRNATVKGFELVLELSGKMLAKLLKGYFADPGQVDKLYYMDIFRHAARHKLIDADLAERWAKYRNSRNNTVHHYGEELAEEALRLLADFIKDAKLLREAFDRAEA